jgi:segregation and condensation protein B
MELSTIIPHIEALIFASDKPLTSLELVEYVNSALGFIEDQASLDQVESAVEGIREKYDAEFYAFELKQSGGGWQFLTKPQYHKTVALINGDKFMKKLSTAALETLSIIAYKQPVTKSEMESIRGVNCDYAVQKLLEKDLVVISGRNEDAVGKPLIYSTSKSFMDYFGINSPEDLPKINEVLMQEYERATSVTEIMAEQEQAAAAEAAAANGDEEEQHIPTPIEEAEEGLEEDGIDRPDTDIVLDVEELEIGEDFDTSALEEAGENIEEEEGTAKNNDEQEPDETHTEEDGNIDEDKPGEFPENHQGQDEHVIQEEKELETEPQVDETGTNEESLPEENVEEGEAEEKQDGLAR